MREELMTEALCWELEAKVTAEYAYTRKNLTYFCPEENCLVEVRPKKLKNTYFYAPNLHEPGCINEAATAQPSPHPGQPNPKPSPAPAPQIPTILGAGPVPRPRGRPTKADLLKLAQRARILPVSQPGTLEEVVAAWAAMSSNERANHPLSIAGQNYNYVTAFSFLANANPDIIHLDCRGRIVFGAAKVTVGGLYYFVSTRKTFDHQAARLPIRLDVTKNSPLLANVPGLVGQHVTLFWHGNIPSIARSGAAFLIHPIPGQIYEGAIVLDGILTP